MQVFLCIDIFFETSKLRNGKWLFFKSKECPLIYSGIYKNHIQRKRKRNFLIGTKNTVMGMETNFHFRTSRFFFLKIKMKLNIQVRMQVFFYLLPNCFLSVSLRCDGNCFSGVVAPSLLTLSGGSVRGRGEGHIDPPPPYVTLMFVTNEAQILRQHRHVLKLHVCKK